MLASLARWAISHGAALCAALSALGCATGSGPFQPRIVAALPSDRVVPLRIVQPIHCDGCTECERSCRNTLRAEDVIESVNRASETFAAAGIRFSFTAVERIEAPTWWKFGVKNQKRTWEQIRDEAQEIFPWMPDDAWKDPKETKTTDLWLEVLTAVYARPHELTVFTQWGGGGNRGGTHFPIEGRGMWVMDGMWGHGPGGGHHPKLDSLYLFGHELGHYFGLAHTFAHEGVTPVNDTFLRLADRWDLVYHPGSSQQDPHVFFSSREEALRYPENALRVIEEFKKGVSNCNEEPDGAIECVLPGLNGYSETHRSGSPALKGLSFPLGPEGGRYRFARNSLSYGDMEIPRRLSASQIELTRQFLQHQLAVHGRLANRWGRLPDGVGTVPSYRHMLGIQTGAGD